MRNVLKSFSLVIAFVFVLQLMVAVMPMPAVEAAVISASENKSRELKVKGNKIVYADDESVEVVLRGVNVPSGEWDPRPNGENMLQSTVYAMKNMDCNLVRLCVGVEGWFFEWPQSKLDDYHISNNYDIGGEKYRAAIDAVINEVSKAGKYIVLDMHHYGIFNKQREIDFWDSAAARYKNNPTVLFGLLNEPTVGWDEWLNGDKSAGTVNGQKSVGYQFMVERIRNSGAKNILIAGGPSYSGTLAKIGTDEGYDLIDQGSGGDKTKKGNGIMYDFHRYPSHGTTDSWIKGAGIARLRYPILMGEFGWMENNPNGSDPFKGEPYPSTDPRYHTQWFPTLFNWMNDYGTYGNYVNWTAFAFHPTAGPPMLVNKSGWAQDYELNNVFGTYIRDELARVREADNVSKDKTPTVSGTDAASNPANATDGDRSTAWVSDNTAGDKWLELDLGANYDINRWYVRHSTTTSQITADFKLQYKLDEGDEWADADNVSGALKGNGCSVTDRFIKTINARYVRLYITKPAPSGNTANIFEFAVMKDATPVYNKTVPYYNLYNPFGKIVKNAFIPANGDMMTVWPGNKSPSYEENGTVMRLSGGYTFEYLTPATHKPFGDLNDVDFYSFRMKSTKEMSVQLQTVNRTVTPNVTVSSQWAQLPSTDGEWKDVYLTPEALGYTPTSNTWLKTAVAKYNKEYNPLIRLNVNTNGGTVDITNISSYWDGTANIAGIDFYNNGAIDNEGLKAGITDIVMTLRNPGDNALDGSVLVAGMYGSRNELVSISAKKVNVESGEVIKTLTLTMPAGSDPDDYHIKIFVLKDENSYTPYSKPIEFRSDGMHL